jgi:ADP-ribose pyrophosphatase
MSAKIVPWNTLRSEIVFDHRWYKLRRDHVELPSGRILDDYFVSVRPDVVLVFPITSDERVVLVRQYKHAAGEILIELPGGVVDAEDAEPGAAARRELLEETGYEATELEHVLTVRDNPTKDTNRVHFFVARNVRRVAHQELDETENIEVLTVAKADIAAMIRCGDIHVASSVALCLLAS